MFVHSPPDIPHLITLFCFLISRNAKCLCHLWTAKRANLGFSLIATVTSLLRLHWGWVEGMAGGWEDGRMKTQLSSHTAEVWKNAAGQQNAAWRSPTAGSGGQPALWKTPTPSWELLGPLMVSQLRWRDVYIGFDNRWMCLWYWHLLPHLLELVLKWQTLFLNFDNFDKNSNRNFDFAARGHVGRLCIWGDRD